ncbi:hypothetical protein [Litorivivens sp.]|uniref:hypothetical protein n=1 Tax=Litorivivens sp. TaxID=2020868 RepID=UPI0035688ADB
MIRLLLPCLRMPHYIGGGERCCLQAGTLLVCWKWRGWYYVRPVFKGEYVSRLLADGEVVKLRIITKPVVPVDPTWITPIAIAILGAWYG